MTKRGLEIDDSLLLPKPLLSACNLFGIIQEGGLVKTSHTAAATVRAVVIPFPEISLWPLWFWFYTVANGTFFCKQLTDDTITTKSGLIWMQYKLFSGVQHFYVTIRRSLSIFVWGQQGLKSNYFHLLQHSRTQSQLSISAEGVLALEKKYWVWRHIWLAGFFQASNAHLSSRKYPQADLQLQPFL